MRMNSRIFLILSVAVFATTISLSYQQQCVTVMDLMFLMDGSNSMGFVNFKTQMNILITLIGKLNVSNEGIHVGVVLFSTNVVAVVNLTGDKEQVINDIRNMQFPDEETRTDLAIDKAVEILDKLGRPGSVPKLMMLVTDGMSTNPILTDIAARKGKAKGYTIIAVGVTKQIDIGELNRTASEKNKGEYQVYVTENFTTLEGTLNSATHRACVDLKCYRSMIDIAFVIDSSLSIGTANFQIIKNFVYEFLLFAGVDNGDIRVGLVTFSNTATVQFNLNTYTSKAEMNNAINNLTFSPGQGPTKIEDALKIVRRNIFTKEKGDRPDVNNVLIFLSANALNVNINVVSDEADATRAAGNQIYGVGIGHSSSQTLDAIVSKPVDQTRLMINNFSQLTTTVPELYNKFNKFCETPPPVPACYMGDTNIWFVVEVSRTAQSLSRFQYIGDFYQLKNGVTKLLDIVQDPSVSNINVSTGLIAYSDTFRTLSTVSQANSVKATANAVKELPGNISQGGSSLVAALQSIVTTPVVSKYKSYVVTVAPETTYTMNAQTLQLEMTRLKVLGYTLVNFIIRENGLLDQDKLKRDASGSRYFYYIQSYVELEAAAKNFTRDGLCNGVNDPEDRILTDENSTSLCAESGHRVNGVGTVPHPQDCDKYIQCYYNHKSNMDLGVVRQCPMGLHFNNKTKTCTLTSQAGCAYDKCMEACKPYTMIGSCRSYWDCEYGVSTPKCCPENYAFVLGFGCQRNTNCTDDCVQAKSCGLCQKKPNWDNRAGYDVMMLGGNMWVPRPCFYDNFNVLDCDCTDTRDQVCPADRNFDFTDPVTLQATLEGNKEGIRTYEIQKSSEGIVLGSKSSVHLNVNHRKDETEPFSLELRFRETRTFSPYGEILVSSGLTCGESNSLLLMANDKFIFAEVRSADARLAEVKVPTQGLNTAEFKTLVLSYNDGVLALSIKDNKTQYMAKTEGLSNICLACGLDLGRGLNKLSFAGEIQKIAVYSCALPLLS